MHYTNLEAWFDLVLEEHGVFRISPGEDGVHGSHTHEHRLLQD